jgi:opacity protein-like surface antigen
MRRSSKGNRVLHLVAASVAITLGVIPCNAVAQKSTTRGWSLGAHLQAANLSVENGDAATGGGIALRVGYGFNRRITGFVHLDGGSIEFENTNPIGGTWTIGHADLGVRFHFANSLRRWVPYVETAIGVRAVSVDSALVGNQVAGKVTFSGSAFTLGGGLSSYLKPSLALDANMKWTGGRFTRVDLGAATLNDLDIDAGSFRFGVGFIWWP